MNQPPGRSISPPGRRMPGPAPLRRIDVIIVGGGPAGTATALALARAGYSVTVLERSRYEAFRVGETLPPEVQRPLRELGVWEQFLAQGHLESPGIVSAWGEPELYDNDLIVNPYGLGWHVDRQRFDAMLAHGARAVGAEILEDNRQTTCIWEDSARWYVEGVANGRAIGLCGRCSSARPADRSRRSGGCAAAGSSTTSLWGSWGSSPPETRRAAATAVP